MIAIQLEYWHRETIKDAAQDRMADKTGRVKPTERAAAEWWFRHLDILHDDLPVMAGPVHWKFASVWLFSVSCRMALHAETSACGLPKAEKQTAAALTELAQRIEAEIGSGGVMVGGAS